MDYILQTQDLVKAYRGVRALDGLTMQVPRGAIYGFVGRNGAGKTTLMRLVCGFQRPTAGHFSLFGVPGDGAGIVRARRRVGAIVETPSIYMDMSAANNLRQQALILGCSTVDPDDLLKLVGLSDAGKKKAKHFSLGMKQRLGIAMVLIGQPEFLILDEPINGLDPQGIVEMRGLLTRLNRDRGITILISSHILDELARLATHFGIIDRGRMVREMSASELERACRRCMRVEVSDGGALFRVLDGMHAEYRPAAPNAADIYGEVDITPLALALHEQNCDILSIREQDESLERFFLSLVGGETQ